MTEKSTPKEIRYKIIKDILMLISSNLLEIMKTMSRNH